MEIKEWDELTPKQKVKRWATAVQVIENLSDHEIKDHFKMGTWVEKTDCGTVGCAAGLLACNPTVRRQGFEVLWERRQTRWGGKHGGIIDGQWTQILFMVMMLTTIFSSTSL